MEVYLVEQDNMKRVPESELEYEENLEQRLVRTDGARIGGVEILYVARQGSPGEGGIFDILAVDKRGDAVILELKRERAPRDIVAQALEYAGEIRNVDYDYLDSQYRQFLRDEQGYTEPMEIPPLREAHAEYFDLDEQLSEREFNDDQRLVVVGTDFQDVALNMADFLREHGIDVVAVEYSTYRSEDGVELLTTDGVRRPLSQEPASVSKSTSDTSYAELNRSIRDRIFKEVREHFRVDEPEEMVSGTLNSKLKLTSNHPDHPDPIRYDFVPWIEKDGEVRFRLSVWDNDEIRDRMVPIIRRYADELDEYEPDNDLENSKVGMLVSTIPVSDDEISEAQRDQFADRMLNLIHYMHPKVVEEFDDKSQNGEA